MRVCAYAKAKHTITTVTKLTRAKYRKYANEAKDRKVDPAIRHSIINIYLP
jgi:hypothetical protein